MSTAANHRKRSHRSEFRSRPYRGGTRSISFAPTVRKKHDFSLMKLIRQALARRMATRAAARISAQATKEAP